MSAALQQALPSHNPASLITAASGRRDSSSNRDEYYASQHYGEGSPSSSSRRPSNRPGANEQQPAFDSPMSSRQAITSPIPVANVPTEHQSSGAERRRNMPAAVPPRTSSSAQQQPGSAGASSSRRTHASRAQADPNGHYVDYDESHGSRSRRSQQPYQESEQRTSSNRDGRGAPSTALPIRGPSSTQSPTSPQGPSREASEILNSILISQDEVDIEREQQRLAMAQVHNGAGARDDDAAPPPISAMSQDHGEEGGRRSGRSRQDHPKREKHTKFGEYILGSTIGEGEFGKVKLGWKQEGGVQVAIKLIKKDQVGSNPNRMTKIRREVAILQQLSHPNIVKLHKMEESERHYGIVLEYASGGELFDYILNHRYLKDNAARRLFAQLISGVGYLHKKGIVHRDLKLENLLLDRNRNIIITDFGFANTFDPHEELSEEEELNLGDKEFVKRIGLDKIKANGSRKGDLMQTSCGSPCYAAPELVVSDAMYTGRKVDVWSCGVILYAMLAGYLPFDDDPANPEGDNINLLYKYIVHTPLTFPEYVTPHARDLLRRILVANPRKRADLFEVARHSWLSEFAPVVAAITSSITTSSDIQNTTVPAEDEADGSGMVRSASVRESSKKATASPTIGGLTTKQGNIDPEAEAAAKQQRENKRRTVQVEYVAPNTTTQRGEPAPSGSRGKTRARSGSQGPVEVAEGNQFDAAFAHEEPSSRDGQGQPIATRKPPSAHRNQPMQGRPSRGDARAISDTGFMTVTGSAARPTTGEGMGQRPTGAVTRASYGQVVPPELADTNAHGRIQQPIKQESYDNEYSAPSAAVPPKFAQVAGFAGHEGHAPKGHKRSNTVGEISGKIFGRTGSFFGGKGRKRSEVSTPTEKGGKRYPPISMNKAQFANEEQSRPSMDSKRSRRSFTMGLGKKRSGSIAGESHDSRDKHEKHNRRFSFIPGSFSLKSMGIGKDNSAPHLDSQQDLPIQEPPVGDSMGRYRHELGPDHVDAATIDNMYAQLHSPSSQSQHGYQFPASQSSVEPGQWGGRPGIAPQYPPVPNVGSESSIDYHRRPPGSAPHQQSQTTVHDGSLDARRVLSGHAHDGRNNRGVLTKNKRFVDAWDADEYSRPNNHSGSSGPARKVMDFFRRRGKARGGDH